MYIHLKTEWHFILNIQNVDVLVAKSHLDVYVCGMYNHVSVETSSACQTVGRVDILLTIR